MSQIILVGGIPNSGKSYITDQLTQRRPERYSNLGLDHLDLFLEENPLEFFRAVASFYPDFFSMFRLKKPVDGKESKKSYETLRERLETTNPDFLEMLLQQAANAYAIAKVSTRGESIPVIESLFLNEDLRLRFFESFAQMAEMTNRGFDIYSVPKTLAYLDLGLDVSLERYRKNPLAKPIINERLIRHVHSIQTIPKSSEFPNLEVVVLRGESEVNRFIEEKSKS